VDRVEPGAIEQAARHGRLIGDDRNRVPDLPQKGDRPGRARNELEIFLAAEMVDLDIDRAVPIEENRRPSPATF
jgi:hypothetical protein